MEFLSQPMANLFMQTALWVIPVFMLLNAVRFLLPRLRGMAGEALVGMALEQCSPNVLHDIIIPDGKGGMTQLDHVLLTAEGLLVVETRNYRGLIFGTPRERHWTQRLGHSSHCFLNPLWQNQLHIKALQALNLGVPVCGRVVFTDQAQFPKGRPRGVSQLSSLQDDLAEQLRGEPGTTHRGAWFQLKRFARTDKSSKKAQLATIAAKHGEERRTTLAYALLGISLAWMFILWLNAPVGMPASIAMAAASTTIPNQPIKQRTTQTQSHLIKAASTVSSRRIVGYQLEWVAGRSLEECLGPDRRLNPTVLRCRQGYQRRVAVFTE